MPHQHAVWFFTSLLDQIGESKFSTMKKAKTTSAGTKKDVQQKKAPVQEKSTGVEEYLHPQNDEQTPEPPQMMHPLSHEERKRKSN